MMAVEHAAVGLVLHPEGGIVGAGGFSHRIDLCAGIQILGCGTGGGGARVGKDGVSWGQMGRPLSSFQSMVRPSSHNCIIHLIQ